MYIDTHCHFEKQYYDDFDTIIDNATNNGINKIIACGCSKSSNIEAINVAKLYPNVFTTIGFHPDQAEFINDSDLLELESHLKENKVVGIGEIGLDYHYDGFNKEKQLILFEKQLSMAEKLNLPVVIHSRDATFDTINTLKKYNVKGVIHSFNGSYETAKIYLLMGFKLGINGVITFKNCNLKDVVAKLSPEDILLETDAPYLTPHPFRGTKNESKNINIIGEFVSNIFDISPLELAKITSNNAHMIFDI